MAGGGRGIGGNVGEGRRMVGAELAQGAPFHSQVKIREKRSQNHAKSKLCKTLCSSIDALRSPPTGLSDPPCSSH